MPAKRPDAPGCIVLDVRFPGRSGLDMQRDDRVGPPVVALADAAVVIGVAVGVDDRRHRFVAAMLATDKAVMADVGVSNTSIWSKSSASSISTSEAEV